MLRFARLPRVCLIVLFLSLPAVAAPPQAEKKAPKKTEKEAAPAVAWSGNKVVLTAAQSRGGVMVTLSDKTEGVSLDRSCDRPWPAVVCIEWNLAAPLPPGWWHGVVEFSKRDGEDRYYVNAQLGVVLRSSQKPMANMMNNFRHGPQDPQRFEFWMHLTTPAGGVQIQDVYAQLWKYKRTWPIRQVTLEHVEPAGLKAGDSVTLELPVPRDGEIRLPTILPAGLWSLTGAMRKEGAVICEGLDGRRVEGPFHFDRWRRPSPVRFHLDAPLKKIAVKTSDMFWFAVLENSITSEAESIATDRAVMTCVDPARPQTAELELLGEKLSGDAPALPIFPGGRRTAVLTTWDDGAPTDLRLAEILDRLGYHPTFFFNQNNAMMKSLEKIESMHVEVGSHCYHHPFLHILPPRQAMEECVEMRELLERELRHPVISFAYPNGYTPAYDTQGDYVLRAVRTAGYWSGRTTDTAAETFDSIADPLALKTNGFFGDRKGLEKAFDETRAKEGGIFAFWGHSWQIGKTDAEWKDFETFVAKFAGQPQTWYAAQGELFLWLWSRKNVRLEVAAKTAGKVTVRLTRPWLDPWLAARCPLSLKLPAGVTKVVWQGRQIAAADGYVELPWVAGP